jgi:hypothetical protein
MRNVDQEEANMVFFDETISCKVEYSEEKCQRYEWIPEATTDDVHWSERQHKNRRRKKVIRTTETMNMKNTLCTSVLAVAAS